jgi:hypothetical protein
MASSKKSTTEDERNEQQQWVCTEEAIVFQREKSNNNNPVPRYTTQQQHQQQSLQIRLKSEPEMGKKNRDCLGDLPEAREADSKESKNLSRILEKQTLSSSDLIRFGERETINIFCCGFFGGSHCFTRGKRV